MISLDVGSGGLGYSGATLRGHVCIDILKPSNQPQNFVQADAHHLPFRNDVFDKVYFYDVIEHVDSPINCLKEIYRVLKRSGILELSTPNPLHWRIWFRAFRGKDIVLGQSFPDHIGTWTDCEMRNILERSGFSNIKLDYRILEGTREYDVGHMRFDLPLFHLGFKRVTGRAIIAFAEKMKL